jgi:hypothetical protein
MVDSATVDSGLPSLKCFKKREPNTSAIIRSAGAILEVAI